MYSQSCVYSQVLQASYVDYKYGRKTSDFEAATDWEYVEWQVKVTHILS